MYIYIERDIYIYIYIDLDIYILIVSKVQDMERLPSNKAKRNICF